MAHPLTPLTLMAVHAHPDDEAISTGGVLALAAAEGIRTVIVTCTNGELGDGPGGVKPGEEGHAGAPAGGKFGDRGDRRHALLTHCACGSAEHNIAQRAISRGYTS